MDGKCEDSWIVIDNGRRAVSLVDIAVNYQNVSGKGMGKVSV